MRGGQILLFAGRRLLHAIPLLLAVVVLNFALIASTPGDPVTVLVGDFPAPPEYLAQVRHNYGLDQPVPVQIAALSAAGAAGRSRLLLRQPPAGADADPRPARRHARAHAAPRCVFASVLGVTLGVLVGAAGRRRARSRGAQRWRPRDTRCRNSGWGSCSSSASRSGSAGCPRRATIRCAAAAARSTDLRYLVLPAFALSLRYLALIARITRTAMLEVLGAEFVLAARARGSSERAVLLGARAPQRRGAGDHGDRLQSRLHAGRIGADRDGVRLAGHRPAAVRQHHAAATTRR